MKILHIFPDIMNLYGEYANLSILKRFLNECGHEVSIETLSLYEDKDISGFDMYYMGAGTEENLHLACDSLIKYQDTLSKAMNTNRVILFTGNAMEALGQRITDKEGKTYTGLGLFEYTSEESDKRVTFDSVSELDNQTIVGFINKCSSTRGVVKPLFHVLMGQGDNKDIKTEGAQNNNCLGTHLTGPLLVKNPYILKKIAYILTKDESVIKHEIPEQEASYSITAQALKDRMKA